MMLAEIEQEIKPLNRLEKLRLIHFLVDEIAGDEPDPARYFRPGDKHVVWIPCDEHKAAYQMQQMLRELK